MVAMEMREARRMLAGYGRSVEESLDREGLGSFISIYLLSGGGGGAWSVLVCE